MTYTLLDKEDIVIDGGNSALRHHLRTKRLKDKSHFLGVGISGGEEGAGVEPTIMRVETKKLTNMFT